VPNAEYTPYGGDVTCSGCGVSYRQIIKNGLSVFKRDGNVLL